MYVIIGGEERSIEQVDTFAEYVSADELAKMSAKEIFYGARANKLFDKIVQIEVDKIALDLANGNPVELMPVEHPIDKYVGGDAGNSTNIDRAKQLEYFYAEQATKFARG